MSDNLKDILHKHHSKQEAGKAQRHKNIWKTINQD